MIPVAVLPGTKKSDFTILHKCEKCGAERKNRLAPDDDMSVLFQLSKRKMYG